MAFFANTIYLNNFQVLQHNRDDPHEREIMKDDSLKWALFFLVIGVVTGIGMILQVKF